VITYLGVDIGGTNIKVATVSDRGRVRVRGLIETAPAEGPTRAFARIHQAARSLAARTGIHGVGVGCAGLIDARRGILRASPNLKAWEGAALGRLARAHFSVPVVIENDATSAAYGESFVRGARGRNLVALTLGTGVGGGIVVDGRVVRGAHGYGGEIGHMTVDPDGPRCRCGARGCLEAYAGSYGVVRLARAALRRRGRRPTGRLTPRAVMEAARSGDAAARDAVRAVGEALGIAIASMIDVVNPSIVTVGGGIAGAFDLLEPHVRRMVRRHAFRESAYGVTIERFRLGNDAALVGAAMLSRRRDTRRTPSPRRIRPV
jgi:glucokinase